jgi:hypothetical protein
MALGGLEEGEWKLRNIKDGIITQNECHSGKTDGCELAGDDRIDESMVIPELLIKF